MGIKGFTAHCWVCGKHKLIDTFAELLRLDGRRCRAILAGLDFQQWEKEVGRPLPGGLKRPKGVGPLLPPHERYLRRRGFDPAEVAEVWGVKGIGAGSRLAWRIYLPVRFNGEEVSWTTRSISDRGQRYISAKPDQEKLPAQSLLFGADLAAHAIVIAEGPFDAMRIGPGAVATFGTNYTKAQLLKMAEFPVRVVVYDNEPLAQQQARKLCCELEAFDGRTYRVNLNAKDPGSAPEEELERLRKRFAL
jgi:hypothetical protein